MFDNTPWKVQICQGDIDTCMHEALVVPISSLPPAPEPGRIPPGATHVHIVPAYSGTQGRDAREEDKWKSLMKSVCRCEHGKLMGDRCPRCPGRIAPDEEGQIVGFTHRGAEVRIPSRKDLDHIIAWIATEDV